MKLFMHWLAQRETWELSSSVQIKQRLADLVDAWAFKALCSVAVPEIGVLVVGNVPFKHSFVLLLKDDQPEIILRSQKILLEGASNSLSNDWHFVELVSVDFERRKFVFRAVAHSGLVSLVKVSLKHPGKQLRLSAASRVIGNLPSDHDVIHGWLQVGNNFWAYSKDSNFVSVNSVSHTAGVKTLASARIFDSTRRIDGWVLCGDTVSIIVFDILQKRQYICDASLRPDGINLGVPRAICTDLPLQAILPIKGQNAVLASLGVGRGRDASHVGILDVETGTLRCEPTSLKSLGLGIAKTSRMPQNFRHATIYGQDVYVLACEQGVAVFQIIDGDLVCVAKQFEPNMIGHFTLGLSTITESGPATGMMIVSEVRPGRPDPEPWLFQLKLKTPPPQTPASLPDY